MNISAKTYLKRVDISGALQSSDIWRRLNEESYWTPNSRGKQLSSVTSATELKRIKPTVRIAIPNTKSCVIYRLIEQLLILQSYGTLFPQTLSFYRLGFSKWLVSFKFNNMLVTVWCCTPSHSNLLWKIVSPRSNGCSEFSRVDFVHHDQIVSTYHYLDSLTLTYDRHVNQINAYFSS